ncbi:MAG TPA: acetate uptake transporter [Anaeromyxobacteraceae bacterium]|nr:acetate uptake transporter [Anaeromyxobacteraceae bacterium]
MEQTKVVEMKEAIADPATVGLASFGIALFTLSFLNAGIVGANAVSVIIPLALITGVIHFFACWFGFRKNELFTALVFGIYGMFWVVFSLINLGVALKIFVLDAPTLQVFLIAYTIFTAYVLLASLVTNWAVILTLAVLLAVFLLLDFSLSGKPQLGIYAGYVGMVDGLMALYISAAGLLGALYGRSVLPVFPVQRAAPQQLQPAA